MKRFEDTPDLFGAGMGGATSGDFKCDVCGQKYNEGAAEAGDYHRRDSVGTTLFAGLDVGSCCFEAIETAVLQRADDLLPWLARIIARRKIVADRRVALMESIANAIKGAV